MSNLNRFFKQNKVQKENGKFAPTVSLTDEKGVPLKWEFKHITTKEDEELRDKHTKDIPIPGKPGMYRQKLDTSGYIADMICSCTVYPDLYNTELQDSYGVKKPEDLLTAMVDNPGEYQDFQLWIQAFQGFKPISEKVDDAKN